jgi:hypothetical protein
MATILASADVARRCGATSYELGFIETQPAPFVPNWYGTATFAIGQVSVSPLQYPWEAADRLARAILEGGHCLVCERRITTHTPTLEGAGTDPRYCRWTRVLDRWVPDSHELGPGATPSGGVAG